MCTCVKCMCVCVRACVRASVRVCGNMFVEDTPSLTMLNHQTSTDFTTISIAHPRFLGQRYNWQPSWHLTKIGHGIMKINSPNRQKQNLYKNKTVIKYRTKYCIVQNMATFSDVWCHAYGFSAPVSRYHS